MREAPVAVEHDARTPLLAARDLTKRYGPRLALAGVSLVVHRGSFLAVMGPSGSGKSTLLHMLGALDTPTRGEVVFDGRPLADLSDRERTLLRRHRIGFVFQAFNLVPVLSAEDNIALPAVIEGRRPFDYQDRLDQVLDAVGLVDRRHQLPSELSGGEQQRVAMGRALFSDPELVLADEPTGNLDSRTGREILELLSAVRTTASRTVVLVTHDAAAAAAAERVVLLRDGRVAGELVVEGEGAARTASVLGLLRDSEQ